MLALRAYHSRLFSAFHSLTTKNMFSQISKGPTLSAQKAVLATAVIDKIFSSNYPNDFNDLTLRESILKLNPLIDNREISKQAKDEIFGLFTKGIPLNYKVYSKGREQYPRQTEEFKQFVFSPTHLTTKPIFQFLLYVPNNKILLNGQLGVGKTASFILFIEVSRHIHKYYFQAQRNQQSKREYQALTQQKLIRLVPKCLYWSADAQENMGQEFNVQKFVLSQVSEIPKQKRKILESKQMDEDEFRHYFKQIYSQKIKVRLIIDQVHSMAQLSQECLRKKDPFECYPSGEIFDKFFRLSNLQSSLQWFASKSIFATSTKIREEITNNRSRKFSLNIRYNDPPPKRALPFQPILKKEGWAKIDFFSQCWFQIQQFLIKNNTVSNADQIKRVFFAKCAERHPLEIKSYLRFVDFKRFLEKNPSELLSIIQNSPKDSIEKKMDALIDSFIDYCLSEMGSKLAVLQQGVKSHVDRGHLLRLMCNQVLEKCDKQQQQGFELKKIMADLMKRPNPPSDSDQQQNELFYYSSEQGYFDQQKVIFDLSSFEMAQILCGALYPQATKYLNFRRNLKEFSKGYNRPLKGFPLRYSLLSSIKEGTNLVFPLCRSQQLKKPSKTSLTIAAVGKFTPFINHEQGTQSNFEWLLKTCKESPNDFVAALPFKLIKGESVIDCNSFVVDLAVAVFDSQKGFTLYTFDLALSKDRKYIQQRRNAAAKLLTAMLTKQTSAIKVKHIIVCLAAEGTEEKAEENEQKISDSRLQIFYSDWRSIKELNKVSS